VGGALTPVVTGLIYCNLIACCRQVYAWERSREWTQVLTDWCDAQPQLVQFNGQCRLHRAEIMELSGEWQDAVAESRRAAQSVARAISAQTAAGAAYQEAEIHRLRGEFAQAEERFREASRLGLEPQPGMALMRLAQGQAGQAAATLRRVLGATADPLARARLLPAFVEILLETGVSDEVRDAVAELERIASKFATALLQATAAQARGELQVHEGAAAAGLAHLRAALDTWRDAGAPYMVARLRVLAGKACRVLGDEDGARLEFDAARDTFEQLGAMPDLERLRLLLAVPAEPIPAAGGLSRREVEVLRLVAAGKTNKRIALDLSLSEKTVDRHLSNIFDKLQVPSRAAATAFAIQNRLL
jgi:DNA-binding CsgD family transcriptional regulator